MPEIVPVPNGDVTLQAMVFRPRGSGPFPAIVYAHGNEPVPSFLFEKVGPAVAARGYYVIGVHRRGSGLSADQATNLLRELTEIQNRDGIDARSRTAIAELEGPQLDDIAAAINMAASNADIDPERVFLIGNSFGGVLAMFAAERGLGLKGAANFAGSAMNWERSELFRERMRAAARSAQIPVFLAQAKNDFSTLPTSELAQELARSGTEHRAKIFPSFGITPVEGHSFGIDGVDYWFEEVMSFLDLQADVPAPDRSVYTARDDLDWQEAHTDGFPEGRTRALLHRNATGGGTAIWRLPKGHVEPRHVHRNGDHRIYVLKGSMTYGDRRVEAGQFIDTPAGQPHGPITAIEDTEFLIWADHALDLEILP